MRVILCTAPEARAPELARTLVEERLVACVNLLPGVRSIYRWQGKVEDGVETLMLMKTRDDRVADLLRRIPELHPYEVPEIVSLPVERAAGPYAAWVEAEADPAAP